MMDPRIRGDDVRSEVTPPALFMHRRRWLQGAGVVGSVAATSAVYRWLNPVSHGELQTPILEVSQSASSEAARRTSGFIAEETLTSESDVVSYNNFYEFTTDKHAVANVAKGFDTRGWTIEIGGLVEGPRTISIDDLMQMGPLEERIYRMRCVEAWSMVIPWAGIQLSHVLEAVRPLATAKYVALETLYAPERMPGQRTMVLDWPYVEGLRLDEAMHPLTLLALGIYSRALPPQDGAPVRLVVPWKYGFKGIKSIVKITLTDRQPPTSWNRYAPSEYGFLANVNPEVPHPRWSQATEQRIGESGRRPTLMFNGYADQVAHMYEGMDLATHY